MRLPLSSAKGVSAKGVVRLPLSSAKDLLQKIKETGETIFLALYF